MDNLNINFKFIYCFKYYKNVYNIKSKPEG